MDDFIQILMQFMQQLEQNIDELDDAEAAQAAQLLSEFVGFVQEQSQQQPPQEPTSESLQGPPPGSSAQLLWILAGQKVDAFVHYLSNYPDAQTQALLRNPEELDRTIQFLNRIMPAGQEPSLDGIQHADINSSNIYGFRYDPKSGNLRVRFQNGSVYGYQGVPPGVFDMFKRGAIPAKTNGQNNYGRWWTGKVPSLGATFYQLIRSGGYPYQKLS